MIVLHNCVKAPENVAIARPLRLVEIVQHCIDSHKYKEHFVIVAVMTMSYIMEENEASLAKMAPGTLCLKMCERDSFDRGICVEKCILHQGHDS